MVVTQGDNTNTDKMSMLTLRRLRQKIRSPEVAYDTRDPKQTKTKKFLQEK